MIIPEMGTCDDWAVSGLADALFTAVQQRVLGLLFGQPNRRFRSAEIITLVASGTGAVHRQLRRLEEAGLVVVMHEGNHKYYQANREAPIFHELQGLVVKTCGLAGPLRAALEPLLGQVLAAVVYGSVADGTDHAASDVDVLVISDSLGYADVYAALEGAEQRLARPVSPTVMSREEWRVRRAEPDSFAARIAAQPRLALIGDLDDLRCSVGAWPNEIVNE